MAFMDSLQPSAWAIPLSNERIAIFGPDMKIPAPPHIPLKVRMVLMFTRKKHPYDPTKIDTMGGCLKEKPTRTHTHTQTRKKERKKKKKSSKPKNAHTHTHTYGPWLWVHNQESLWLKHPETVRRVSPDESDAPFLDGS